MADKSVQHIQMGCNTLANTMFIVSPENNASSTPSASSSRRPWTMDPSSRTTRKASKWPVNQDTAHQLSPCFHAESPAPVQCIGEAFSVDMNDEAQKSQLSVKPANLTQIFDVYLKTEAKRGSTSKPAASATASSSATSAVRRPIYKHV